MPPKFLEYHHFGEEHYLTSWGRHVSSTMEISKARRVETFGFLPLYLWKLVAGLALNPKEGSLRTVYRIVMLFLLPGKSFRLQTATYADDSSTAETIPPLYLCYRYMSRMASNIYRSKAVIESLLVNIILPLSHKPQ